MWFYYSLFSVSYCIRQCNWGLKDQLHLWNPAFLYNLIPLPLIFSLAAKWFGRDWLIFSKVTSYTHVIPIKTNARKMGIGNWVFFLLHIYLFYWTLSEIDWQETCKTNEKLKLFLDPNYLLQYYGIYQIIFNTGLFTNRFLWIIVFF